jgi:hypothetical protein
MDVLHQEKVGTLGLASQESGVSPEFPWKFEENMLLVCDVDTQSGKYVETLFDSTPAQELAGVLVGCGRSYIHSITLKYQCPSAGMTVAACVTNAAKTVAKADIINQPDGWMFTSNQMNCGMTESVELVVPSTYTRQFYPVSSNAPMFKFVIFLSHGSIRASLRVRWSCDGPQIRSSQMTS